MGRLTIGGFCSLAWTVLFSGFALLGAAPPPLQTELVQSILVVATVSLASFVLARSALTGLRGSHQVWVWRTAICMSVVAALLASTTGHAAIALLACAISAVSLAEASAESGYEAVSVGLTYAGAVGAASLLADAAAFPVITGSRLVVRDHAFGWLYLGAVPLAIAVLVAAMEQVSTPIRAVATATCQLASWILFIAVVPPQSAWFAPYIPVAIGTIALTLARPRPSPRGRIIAVFACGLGLLWIGGSSFVFRHSPAPVPRGRVVFYSRGGIDWKTPNYERTGPWDDGMFGFLPSQLMADGFNVSFVDSHDQLDASLGAADVIVLINCDEQWSGGQRRSLRRYLDAGGRLLVIGDHTDVFGLMRGYNSFLSEYGISFKFDSAYHASESWHGCTVAANGSLYAAHRFALCHGVGASLELQSPARPLVTGRHGFSDQGERNNIMGSYLGNYVLDPQEEYGDVVLIACSMDSRIVVYGDTTAFQNGALSEAWAGHVRPLFTALAGKRPLTHSWPYYVLSAVGAFAVVALRASAARWFLVGAAAGVLAVNALPTHERARLTKANAAIDEADASLTGHYDARVNAIGPLHLHLARFGFIPVVTQDLDGPSPHDAAVWAIVAPYATASPARVRQAESFVGGGGTLLLIGGGESAIEPYTRAFGMSAGSALGECPPQRTRDDDPFLPRFRRAWSIEASAGTAVEPLFTVNGYCPAAMTRRGAGTVVWIADSLFFSDPNVEGLWGNHRGNMKWIQRVFETALRRPAEPTPELWPSPPKPDE